VEAKLRPPVRRPGTITRERLIRRLQASTDTPVVAVIAPPGYGKTLLLAEWAALDPRPVAWVTIDTLDNVPSVFLAYLALAVDRIHPVDPSLQQVIASSGANLLATAVPRLASEMHRIGQPALLVLDDVHLLTDPTCLDALAALLDHLPAGFQVALAARSVPGLPIARLRARRALLDIDRADLALDIDETEALSEAAGHVLTRAQAGALTERTEGWAAAVYLEALASRRGAAGVGLERPERGPEAFIADYLRAEVLERLDEPDLALLTRTSILGIVEPAAADAVVGAPGAGQRLRSLARANQLIIDLSGSAEAYRYHHLLRDFLAAELLRREPGAVPTLHARAAAWYADAGRMELAIDHALQGDSASAARYVVREMQNTLFRGNGDKLERWVGSFDETAFRRYPPLAVVGAWIYLLGGDAAAAGRLADIADHADYAGNPEDGSASFASSRALLRCIMARRGPDELLADATFAESIEQPGSPWRSLALLMRGAAHHLAGDEAAASADYGAAVEAGATAGVTVASASRASIALARGDWARAEEFASRSRAMALSGHLEHNLASLMTWAVCARVALHRADVTRAREDLVRAQMVSPLASEASPWYSVRALLELARAYLAVSDPEGARNVIAHAEAIARRRPALGVLGRDLVEMRERVNSSAAALAGASALTPAELRILPMLSTPLTFREIGERAFLSYHTVKSHAVSIYGKLEAGSRSEAIERAIEIGLLEPFPVFSAAPVPPD
jgi:LuxR family maltose regulon positive regulatory protein